jgi:hypothetical protein
MGKAHPKAHSALMVISILIPATWCSMDQRRKVNGHHLAIFKDPLVHQVVMEKAEVMAELLLPQVRSLDRKVHRVRKVRKEFQVHRGHKE